LVREQTEELTANEINRASLYFQLKAWCIHSFDLTLSVVPYSLQFSFVEHPRVHWL
jgi:hypothetical protein